jgi:(p)ppGpp synthase/HD superfamily hydrolase
MKPLFYAIKYHGFQMRKFSLTPFVVHPIRVSKKMNSKLFKTVALLHDLVEDTSCTLEDLECFGQEVVEAVDAITHRDGESYQEYIKRLSHNKIASAVKLEDIKDNLNDRPSEHFKKKIKFALEIL